MSDPPTVIDDPATAIYLFAWVAEGTPWSEDVARTDLDVFAFHIEHQENECATLRLDVENPRVGLLAAGRNLWGWLTWRTDDDELVPLFYGRLMGVPDQLQDEIVRLQFLARPPDFDAQKATIAAGLRELPYYDPLWLAEGAAADPDTVLETRTVAWHVDRVTHVVSVSDIGQGEGPTIVLTGDDHFYDGVRVEPGQTPLQSVSLTGVVQWDQIGRGEIDLTQAVYDAFVASGSPFQYPLVGSFTSDGLLSTWPQPGANIGAGWSMAPGAYVANVTWQKNAVKKVRYIEKPVEVPTVYQVAQTPTTLANMPTPVRSTQVPPLDGIHQNPLTLAEAAYQGWKNWDVLFEVVPLMHWFPVTYETKRARTETVTFTMTAGVQPILTDPAGADVEVLAFSSKLVTDPIDAGGAVPLVSVARNSYFPTDRGQLSLQYLLLLARAHLYVRARSVHVTVAPEWDLVARTISCMCNAVVHDDRFPGGVIAGKVLSYILAHDPQKPRSATMVIGCMTGTAEVLDAVADPEDSYADDYSDDYDELEPGGSVPVIAGELRYLALDGAYVIDDDGIDLLNMTPGTVVQSLVVENGVSVQTVAIDDNKTDPVEGLRGFPTTVTLDLVPLTGQTFETVYPITVDQLVLPKTVDLGAPAL